MIINTLRRFTKKVFSSRTYVLALINRFIPEEFGRLVDLALDRDAKKIHLELHKEEKTSTVAIDGYALRHQGSRSFIRFDAIKVEGYLATRLSGAISRRELEVDQRYVSILKKVLHA